MMLGTIGLKSTGAAIRCWSSRRVLLASSLLLLASLGVKAQEQNGQSQSPRGLAPIDLTGYWVSVVSEDWRVRMLMGQKGDWLFMMGRYGSLNEEGSRVAEKADPVNEDPCMAYGAAGIMRIPGRLHITWEDDATLRIDTDAGEQTRLLRFRDEQPSSGDPTRQGYSHAAWEGGQLHVVTDNMTPGYYFKHGVPYSEQAAMTEYFALLPENDIEYLFVTTSVSDPLYMNGTYDRTLTFKKESNGANWNPTPCSVP